MSTSYERFTDRARKAMSLANQESIRYNHEYIGTEHILLGLLQEGCGVAIRVLKNLDLDPRQIRLETEKLVQDGPETTDNNQRSLAPKAKQMIVFSREEARNLNHNFVGTEHLLLGLLRENEGIASQVLINLGLTLDKARAELKALLNLPEATADDDTVDDIPSLEHQAACEEEENKQKVRVKIFFIAHSKDPSKISKQEAEIDEFLRQPGVKIIKILPSSASIPPTSVLASDRQASGVATVLTIVFQDNREKETPEEEPEE